MNKLYRFFYKAFFLFTSILIFLTLSCSSFGSKQSFYNYQEYMSQTSIKAIRKEFNYKTFNDLYEFEKYIYENKTIGGVGSDYLAAKLAKKRLIAKIDYAKIFDQKTLQKGIENLFTNETKQILNQYHLDDYDQDGKKDNLYEYMIPFFSQYKGIVFNIKRISGFTKNDYSLTNEKLQAKYFKNLTYHGILQTLKSKGANNILIADFYRDNIAIGSENKDGSFFDTDIKNKQIANKYINNFKTIINNYADIKDPHYVHFSTKTTSILNKLISKNTKWQTAILHNGDALDAYFGSDNEVGAKDGDIRIIKPLNTLYLVDGIIINKNASKQNKTKFYQVIKNALYQDLNKSQKELEKIIINENYEHNPYMNNFDYLNFNPTFKNAHQAILNQYFDDDQNAKFIYSMKNNSSILQKNVHQIIDSALDTKVQTLYNNIKS